MAVRKRVLRVPFAERFFALRGFRVVPLADVRTGVFGNALPVFPKGPSVCRVGSNGEFPQLRLRAWRAYSGRLHAILRSHKRVAEPIQNLVFVYAAMGKVVTVKRVLERLRGCGVGFDEIVHA